MDEMTGRKSPKSSVLIVEDDALIALHLQELLQNAGYTVPDPVSSGEEAIGRAGLPAAPDIILMDIGLGGDLDGFETARRIRQIVDIPVIFLSGHPRPGRDAGPADDGSCRFITKPFVPADVIAAIERTLGP
jgi:CheY-like chemotaxis protein